MKREITAIHSIVFKMCICRNMAMSMFIICDTQNSYGGTGRSQTIG